MTKLPKMKEIPRLIVGGTIVIVVTPLVASVIPPIATVLGMTVGQVLSAGVGFAAADIALNALKL